MCHQAFQVRVLGCPDGLQDLRGGGARPQPAHAAVDFQVIVAPVPTRCSRQPVPLGDVRERMQYRRQVIFQQARAFGGQEIGHHQNARLDAPVPQNGAFLHVAHRQPARTGGR